MTREYLIETRSLRKSYRRGQEVLRSLDLKVPRGSVYGFLGRNGSGKTTTIRIVMGLLRASGGTVTVMGETGFPRSMYVRQRVGYLSQDQKMFSWMTCRQLNQFTSSFYPAWDREYAESLVQRLDLPMDTPLGLLSKGEQQKAGLMLALAQRPELLVLDEPAASLDTVVRREFIESILDVLSQEGITVLISSQILTDIERIADWIGILHDGRMLVSAPLDDLKESIKRLRISLPDGGPETVDIPGAIRTVKRGREALVTVDQYTPSMLKDLQSRFPGGVEVQDVDLEEIFIELVG